MDNPQSLGELGEHYRKIAQTKMASGCKSCQMEGRVMLEMVEEMERDHANRIGETRASPTSCPIGSASDTSEPSVGPSSGDVDEVQQ